MSTKLLRVWNHFAPALHGFPSNFTSFDSLYHHDIPEIPILASFFDSLIQQTIYSCSLGIRPPLLSANFLNFGHCRRYKSALIGDTGSLINIRPPSLKVSRQILQSLIEFLMAYLIQELPRTFTWKTRHLDLHSQRPAFLTQRCHRNCIWATLRLWHCWNWFWNYEPEQTNFDSNPHWMN